jgi:hypothetical protein
VGNTSSEEHHLMNKIASGRKPLKSKRFLLFERKKYFDINPLTPELNPSVQRCLTRFFTEDFSS